MLALTAAPGKPGNVELREAAEPRPFDHQALVEVKAFSLNRGETRRLADLQDGTITGWDLAGVVRAGARDGSGPQPGARVVGVSAAGAWARIAAVDTDMLSELPDGVSFEQAASLPVAGLTALKSLDIIGPLIAKRVLVTGASGGVGRFAVQLAKLAGAHVVALSANPERARALRALGADEILEQLTPDGEGGEFDGIVEAVGGATLAAAIHRVSSFGVIVSFSSSDTSPVQFPARALFGRAPGACLRGLFLFAELQRERSGARDLARLTQLVCAGRLDCSIDHVASWREAAQAIDALLARRISGKAVLLVD
jgi:NADPH:quinone reductase-like Zn-dependent oxidoreductase